MPVLTPNSDHFKPHALMKQGRYTLVSLVLDLADKKAKVARQFRQPSDSLELQLLEGLERLSKTLRPLAHPNLPHFDKLVEGQGGTWLFFQWFDGHALSDYLGLEDTISDGWIIWWLTELLKALSALHQQDPPLTVGYVDPADVLIHGERLFLCDLGLFENIFPDLAATMVAEHPYLQFIAPERRLAADTTPAGDLFSAAAIAFWLCSGRAPNISGPQVARFHRAALVQARPDLPPRVVDTIIRGLAFQPGDRPATADEMLDTMAPFVVSMAGFDPPPVPELDNVQYRAQTTQQVFSHAEFPQPLVCEEYELPDTPPPPPPFSLGHWLAGHKTQAGLVALALAVTGFGGYGTVKKLAPIHTGFLQVASGPVVEQANRRTRKQTPWQPVQTVDPGAVILARGGPGVLNFGAHSRLTMEKDSWLRIFGQEDGALSLLVLGGHVEVQTTSKDRALLRLPPGNTIHVEPDSDTMVGVSSTKITVDCKMGKSSLLVGQRNIVLDSGGSSRLSTDGRRVLK